MRRVSTWCGLIDSKRPLISQLVEASMDPSPRRIRGLLSTALMWAGAWGLVGAAVGASDIASLGLLTQNRLAFLVQAALEPVLAFAIAGALSGGLFGALLHLMERRRGRIEYLRLGRVAACGAVGAMLLPLSFAAIASATVLSLKVAAITGLFALLGGGSAATTLMLARRGSRPVLNPGRFEGPPIRS